jgi:hypothetical protein
MKDEEVLTLALSSLSFILSFGPPIELQTHTTNSFEANRSSLSYEGKFGVRRQRSATPL